MSKRTREQALRRLEHARATFIKALVDAGREEEIRLAVELQPMVNLRNVSYYAAYYQGARKAFMLMSDKGSAYNMMMGKSRLEDTVYRKALYDLITENVRYTEMFMSGQSIRFFNYERDKKGKLTKCEASFVEEYRMIKRITE